MDAEDAVGLVYRYGKPVSPRPGITIGLDSFGLWVECPHSYRLGSPLPGLEGAVSLTSCLDYGNAVLLVNRCLTIYDKD